MFNKMTKGFVSSEKKGKQVQVPPTNILIKILENCSITATIIKDVVGKLGITLSEDLIVLLASEIFNGASRILGLTGANTQILLCLLEYLLLGYSLEESILREKPLWQSSLSSASHHHLQVKCSHPS